MKSTFAAVSALLIATAAAAQEYVYVYVSAKDPGGESMRHRLECTDSSCKLEIRGTLREVELTDAQRDELRAALQAEMEQFRLGGDGAAAEADGIKLKLKHETPRQRMALERRIAEGSSTGLTPQMGAVLKSLMHYSPTSRTPSETPAGERPAPKPQ